MEVTTWADGFERWWASVPLIWNGRDRWSLVERRAHSAARRAILAALAERGTVDPKAVRVRFIRANPDTGTYLYREG